METQCLGQGQGWPWMAAAHGKRRRSHSSHQRDCRSTGKPLLLHHEQGASPGQHKHPHRGIFQVSTCLIPDPHPLHRGGTRAPEKPRLHLNKRGVGEMSRGNAVFTENGIAFLPLLRSPNPMAGCKLCFLTSNTRHCFRKSHPIWEAI